MSLDDSLAVWAASVRLPAAAADDIYRQIIATPTAAVSTVTALRTASALSGKPALTPTWWQRFTADFGTRMVASTRPVAWAA